jgi:hypothetical protein
MMPLCSAGDTASVWRAWMAPGLWLTGFYNDVDAFNNMFLMQEEARGIYIFPTQHNVSN